MRSRGWFGRWLRSPSRSAIRPSAPRGLRHARGVQAKDMIMALVGRLGASGGAGYALEYQISRVLCDARILSIFEGAAEIQAHVVARGLLARRN